MVFPSFSGTLVSKHMLTFESDFFPLADDHECSWSRGGSINVHWGNEWSIRGKRGPHRGADPEGLGVRSGFKA